MTQVQHDLNTELEVGDAGDTGDTDSLGKPSRTFPTSALPRAAGRIVKEASDAIGCAPELVGLPVLVALSSAIGNSRVLKLKNGWEQGATLWLAGVADPGMKKTPAQKEAMIPVDAYQDKLEKKYKQERKEYESDKEPDEIQGDEPVFGRVRVDDTTVEALTQILRDNQRGVIFSKDELTGFIGQMDQYKGKGNDRQFYLSVWGNQSYTVDRRANQSPIFLKRPFVSLYGGIQPDRLSELSKGIEDGMLDRFLFSAPDFEFNRWTEDQISDGAREQYQCLYDGLRELEMVLDEYGNPNPALVEFSPEAKNLFIQEYNALEDEIRQPGFPKRLKSPWSKLTGYLATLSLIMCLCRVVKTGAEEEVTIDDVMGAKALLSYFKDQARKVYGFLYKADPLDALAGDVARFLEYMDGTYEDHATYVHALIKSEHKPERPDELTKKLKEISKRNPDLVVETGTIGRGNSKKRSLKIFLRNGVPGVPGVPATDDVTQQEVKEAWNNRVAYGQVRNRFLNGEMDQDRAIDLATRVVLYELELPLDSWKDCAPMVQEIIEEQRKELEPPF